MFNRSNTNKDTVNEGIGNSKQTNITSNVINHKPNMHGSRATQQEGKYAQSLFAQKSKEAGYSFLENGGDSAGLNARASNNSPDCINSGSGKIHLQKNRLLSISPMPKMEDLEHQHQVPFSYHLEKRARRNFHSLRMPIKALKKCDQIELNQKND